MLSISKPDKLEKVQFIESSFEGKSYLAAKILVHISATLFGTKPATLINLSNRKDKNLIKLWDLYKGEIPLIEDIEFFELKRTAENLIVLFYNRKHLQETIFNKQNLRFLATFGYDGQMGIEGMLIYLKSRYGGACPHEIGLFLGIPLKDVLGYLKLIALPCSCCGYWKVYGNPAKSISLFQRYRRIKAEVIKLVLSGEDPLEILAKPFSYPQLSTEKEPFQEAS